MVSNNSFLVRCVSPKEQRYKRFLNVNNVCPAIAFCNIFLSGNSVTDAIDELKGNLIDLPILKSFELDEHILTSNSKSIKAFFIKLI